MSVSKLSQFPIYLEFVELQPETKRGIQRVKEARRRAAEAKASKSKK